MSYSRASSPNQWMGLPLSSVSLVTLTIQSAFTTLLIHHSRTNPFHGSPLYTPAAAILMVEIIRLSLSLSLALYNIALTRPGFTAAGLFGDLMSQTFSISGWNMLPSALFFSAQNFLQYAALSHIDPSTFLAAHQTRLVVLATAVSILSQSSLPIRRWMWLGLLAVGVIIMLSPQGPESLARLREGSQTGYWYPRSIDELSSLGSKTAAQLSKRSATYQGIHEDEGIVQPLTTNPGFGVLTTLAGAVFSGAAAAIVEIFIQDAGTTDQGYIVAKGRSGAWVRNVQASLVSIVVAATALVVMEGEHIARYGVFGGFGPAAWAAVVVQGAGGAAVASTLPHGNSSTQPLAAMGSIVIAFVSDVLFFDLTSPFTYVLGTLIVLTSLWSLGKQQGRGRLPSVSSGAGYGKQSAGQNGHLDIPDPESLRRPRSRSPALRMSEQERAHSTSRPNTPLGRRHLASSGMSPPS